MVEADKLTMGEKPRLTLRNGRGEIVARVYILPDGCLHGDSWLCPSGWK